MIILSNALPKTGSTILASYQEDMLAASIRRNGQAALRRKFGGRFIHEPSSRNLITITSLNSIYGSLVIKCHWNFTLHLHLFCMLVGAKMTFAYRDPRDMILSMIDHGKRTRKGLDPSGAFADCRDVIELIPYTSKLLESLKEWQNKKYVHFIKYEDFMKNTLEILESISDFLRFRLPAKLITQIVNQRESTKKQFPNFNKGTTGRWRQEMSEEQKEACLSAFAPFLDEFSYER
jgi:hypothetical protein